MLTIREVLKLEKLQKAYIISGKKGIDNIISGINCMEVPDIENWISASDLLITTCYSIRKNPDRLYELIYNLINKKCAAIMIKLKYFNNISSEIKELSENNDFPIIILPDSVNFSDIINSITTTISNKNNNYLKLSQRYYDLFLENSLLNNGYNAITDVVLKLTSISNALIRYNKINHDINIIAKSGTIKNLKKEKIYSITKSVSDKFEDYFVYKVYNYDDFEYYLLLEKEVDQFNKDLLIKNINNALRYERNKEMLLYNKNTILDNQIIIDLLSGNILTYKEIDMRLSLLNWPSFPYTILYIDIVDFKKLIKKFNESEIIQFKNRVYQFAKNIVDKKYKYKSIMQSDSFIFFISQIDKLDIDYLIEELNISIKTSFKINIQCIYNKDINDIKDIKRAYDLILFISEKLKFNRKQKIDAKDYLYDYFIFNNKDNELLNDYISQILNKFNLFSKNEALDLFKTIKTYVECQGNASLASKKLFIHRNTLNYRLGKLKLIIDAKSTDKDDFYKELIELYKVISIYEIINK